MLETFSRTNRAFGMFRDLEQFKIGREQVLQPRFDGRSSCSSAQSHTSRPNITDRNRIGLAYAKGGFKYDVWYIA